METLIIFGIFMLIAFITGVVLGQKLNRNEKIEVNPVKAVENYVEEKKTKKENDKEQAALETMLDNIDNYDGSGYGQKEIIR